ncbi:uncharacterized protein [Clytia hemisphaerica]|uniref:uncharacterized protein n=1 Tax=Clytia hemisphaerica TaxID=252671 RepID=UPI0034D3ECD2
MGNQNNLFIFSETAFGSIQIDQPEDQAAAIEEPSKDDEREKNEYTPGMHVAAAWLKEDSTEYTWYLGVIDSVDKDCLKVSYFSRKDKAGSQWTFPEEADIQDTKYEQIIKKVEKVAYQCTVRIRCLIPKQLADDITTKLNIFKQ